MLLPFLPGVRPVLLPVVPPFLRLVLPVLQKVQDLATALATGRAAPLATLNANRRKVTVRKGLGWRAPTDGATVGFAAGSKVEPDVEVVASIRASAKPGAASPATRATPREPQVATRRPIRGAPSSPAAPPSPMVGVVATSGLTSVRGGR